MTEDQAKILLKAQEQYAVAVSARGYVSNPFSTRLWLGGNGRVWFDSDYYAAQMLSGISIDDVTMYPRTRVDARDYVETHKD